MTEIIFEVREDKVDGGYTAAALGHSIFTQGVTLEELRANVRKAVQCYFGDGVPGPIPTFIRLHFEYDEILATGKVPTEIEMSEEDKKLIHECFNVIRQEKKASTSNLQRRLRLGYNRAAYVIDYLEKVRVVGL